MAQQCFALANCFRQPCAELANAQCHYHMPSSSFSWPPKNGSQIGASTCSRCRPFLVDGTFAHCGTCGAIDALRPLEPPLPAPEASSGGKTPLPGGDSGSAGTDRFSNAAHASRSFAVLVHSGGRHAKAVRPLSSSSNGDARASIRALQHSAELASAAK